MDTSGHYLPGTPVLLHGAEATPEHCQKLCCDQPNCDTFTFDTGQTAGAADCWLKAGGTLTPGGCSASGPYNCTSGQVRTGHHVGPAPPAGPPGTLEWSTIDKSVVNSTAHQAVAYDAVRRCCWHLGCFLLRVPAMLLWTGAAVDGLAQKHGSAPNQGRRQGRRRRAGRSHAARNG